MNTEHASTSPAAPAVAGTGRIPSARPKRSSRPRRLPLARLLGMADRYRAENAVRQAAEIYFEIIERHPGNATARQAQERLMDMAERYEQSGRRHEARAIYERLM